MIWKPIKGYEGIYEVSDTGLVRSCERVICDSYHKTNKLYGGKLLNPTLNKKGYLQVTLNNKTQKTYGIHRLVAEAFISNPNNYPVVNHIDENKQNNNVENLCWVSRSTNCRNTSQNRKVRVYKNEELIKECCLTEASEIIGCARSSIYSYLGRNQKYINKIYRLEIV